MSIAVAHKNIREKHLLGTKTHFQAIRGLASESRSWLADAPVCSALGDLHIAHCGIMGARPPFEVVRPNLSGTFFLASLKGEGQILVDGRWRSIGPSQAAFQPRFIPNALRAAGKGEWRFCWIRYEEPSDSRPLLSLHTPSIAGFDGEALRLAMEGLLQEIKAGEMPHRIRLWVELIQTYALSFAHHLRSPDAILEVWRQVEECLEDAWTAARIAKLAHISKEHLRRQCIKFMGRAPMQHLAFLRMRKAAERLTRTNESIAQVALRVGYSSQFAFSDAFQKWLGVRPSEYRK